MRINEFRTLKVGDKVKIAIGGNHPGPDQGKICIVTGIRSGCVCVRSTEGPLTKPAYDSTANWDLLNGGERFFSHRCLKCYDGPLKVKIHRVVK